MTSTSSVPASDKLTDEQKLAHAKRTFERADDLYAFCPQCKAKLTGTLEQIQAHKCGE